MEWQKIPAPGEECVWTEFREEDTTVIVLVSAKHAAKEDADQIRLGTTLYQLMQCGRDNNTVK